MAASLSDRSERERNAYDDGEVWEQSHKWHVRAGHVFQCPNTLKHEALFDRIVSQQAKGKRALDLGCGPGISSQKLLSFGAAFVLGVDISERCIAQALNRAVKGRLEFQQLDVNQSFEGRFDLVYGRAILHHLEFGPILKRLYDDNLAPDGILVFMEPLGGNLLTRLFRVLAPAAHTPDERSFTSRDLRWFRDSFDDVRIYPYNYLSYPLGVLSSFCFPRPDNLMLRMCDRVDTWLARRVRLLESRFRQAIIVVRKTHAY